MKMTNLIRFTKITKNLFRLSYFLSDFGSKVKRPSGSEIYKKYKKFIQV